MDKYVICKTLFSGKFGNVYLARYRESKKLLAIKAVSIDNIDAYLSRYRESKKLVAIKVVSKDYIEKANLNHQIKREIDILSIVEHKYIISLIDHFEDDTYIYIVTEYISGGDLYDMIKKENRLDEPTAAKYILQLCDAIEYLHRLNIIHRDIKPENILLTSNNNIKLCDFGWSVIEPGLRTTICGTLYYLPPEMIKGVPYDYRIDLWSIGILTYELLVGKPPFNDDTYKGTYKNIIDGNITYPDYLSEEAKDFISSLLVQKAQDRMTLDMIKNHQWIAINKDRMTLDMIKNHQWIAINSK